MKINGFQVTVSYHLMPLGMLQVQLAHPSFPQEWPWPHPNAFPSVTWTERSYKSKESKVRVTGHCFSASGWSVVLMSGILLLSTWTAKDRILLSSNPSLRECNRPKALHRGFLCLQLTMLFFTISLVKAWVVSIKLTLICHIFSTIYGYHPCSWHCTIHHES